jgi:hypothetical protein
MCTFVFCRDVTWTFLHLPKYAIKLIIIPYRSHYEILQNTPKCKCGSVSFIYKYNEVDTVNFTDTIHLSIVIYLDYKFPVQSALRYQNDELRKVLNHSCVLITKIYGRLSTPLSSCDNITYHPRIFTVSQQQVNARNY